MQYVSFWWPTIHNIIWDAIHARSHKHEKYGSVWQPLTKWRSRRRETTFAGENYKTRQRWWVSNSMTAPGSLLPNDGLDDRKPPSLAGIIKLDSVGGFPTVWRHMAAAYHTPPSVLGIIRLDRVGRISKLLQYLPAAYQMLAVTVENRLQCHEL